MLCWSLQGRIISTNPSTASQVYTSRLEIATTAHSSICNTTRDLLELSSSLDATMPTSLETPVLQVDTNVIHKVDTTNPENLYNMWTGNLPPSNLCPSYVNANP